MHLKTFPTRFKAADADSGTFEAIVSVFGNVDHVGDRVIKGAFAKSLERWKDSGAPIPVVFSHKWDDLDAHIGHVTEAEEREDGLWVKGQLEMDEPFAARVHKKMAKGTLREFSFAYDVVQERPAQDGANDLLELDLIEVGPTLKGVNPATRLLSVKGDQISEAHLRDLIRTEVAAALKTHPAQHATPDATPAEPQQAPGQEPKGRSTFAARAAADLIELG